MTLSPAEIGLTAAVVLLLFALAAVLLLKTRNGSANEAVLRAQSELSGRLAQFSEHYALEQDKLARLLAEQKLSVLQMIDEKLLLITRKVGEGLQMSAGKTDETLGANGWPKSMPRRKKSLRFPNRWFPCRKFLPTNRRAALSGKFS